MSSQSVDVDDREFTNGELLAMDDEEARATLTVDQYRRWEKLTDLHADAEQTRDEWDDEREQVTELTVHADPEALGTRVELYGNDLLVRVDPEDDDFRDAATRLDDKFGDRDMDEVDDFDDGVQAAVGDALLDMLDAILLRWNGHDWADIADADRGAVLADCRDKWGIDGLLKAWVDIAAAVQEDREGKLDVIDNFRDERRRGRR